MRLIIDSESLESKRCFCLSKKSKLDAEHIEVNSTTLKNFQVVIINAEGEGKSVKRRLPIVVFMLFLLILILPFFVLQVESSTSTNTLYAHAETTTIGGVNYYLHKLSSADGSVGTTLSQSASTGRKLMGRWVYPLSGIVSIPASTWTVTYRAMKSASASSVVAHGDIDVLIRKSDNTVRTTLATDVANSPTITVTNTWQTLTGTYNWAAYTVVDQTDYLEVAYYIHVTTSKPSKSVKLLVDDSTLPLADQTKVANVIFAYPNQAPVASFTYSPAEPRAEQIVTFNASASYDPDGNIVTYRWDFGDGNITSVADPIITHVYENCGNYTVTLTVTDNEGLASSVSQIVQVINPSLLRLWADVGSYVGSNPDAWILESWIVSSDVPAGGSVSFNLYIDAISNPSGADPTYDVYLAVAVNDTAQVASITIGSTTITTFTYGEVTWPTVAGGGTLSPHGVYPTSYALAPFGNVSSNHGYYTTPGNPYGPYWAYRAYIPVTITASSAMNAGFKVHFDAQGVLKKGSTKPGYRNTNPFSHDLTFEGSLYIPPIVKYYLTVMTDPEGIVPISGEGWYNNCTYVDLTAPLFVPDEAGVGGERYRFANWTVDGDFVSGNLITVHMNANHTAVAHYVKQYKLIMSTNFGTTSPSVGEHWYDVGSVVSISATAPTVVEGEQYVWLEWTGTGTISYTGTNNADSVTMDSPITETASWRHEYRLIMATNYGTTSPSLGDHWYEAGSIVSISATPPSTIDGERYVWNGWTGTGTISYTGMDNPATVTMNSPITQTASWTHQYRLTMATNFGTTSPSVGEHWYDAGSVVSIGATAPSAVDGEQYVWLGWTGTGTISYTGMDNPSSVTMNSPITETAAWRHEYRLTMATNYGTTSPSAGVHWYEVGTPVPIQAFAPSVIAGEQYVWNGWTGTGTISYTGTANPSSVTMNSPISETASWTHQFLLTIKTSGLPSAYPTKVYLAGSQVGTASDASPYTKWFDAEVSTGSIGVDSTVSGATGTRYIFVKWVEDSSTNNPRASETMNSPKTFTAEYKTQYQITVTASPSGALGGTFKVTYTQCGTTYTNVQKTTSWTEWVDGTTTVTVSEPQDIVNGYKFDSYNPSATVTMDQAKTITLVYEAIPVGGYSISLAKRAPTSQIAAYMLLIALFGVALSLRKRKRK